MVSVLGTGNCLLVLLTAHSLWLPSSSQPMAESLSQSQPPVALPPAAAWGCSCSLSRLPQALQMDCASLAPGFCRMHSPFSHFPLLQAAVCGGLAPSAHQVPTKTSPSLPSLAGQRTGNTTKGFWIKIRTRRDHPPITITSKTDVIREHLIHCQSNQTRAISDKTKS